jgi:cysteine synthase
MVEGYRGLGQELLAQLPGPAAISASCGYVGTAGCFMGTTGALVERWPDLHRVVVEPDESAVLSGRPAGIHHVEGGGIGRWPPKLSEDSFDEVVAVPERRRSRWPARRRAPKASSPARRPAPTSSRRCNSPAASAPGIAW